MLNKLTKHNKTVDRELRTARPTKSMINREEAKVDNNTPGPGLRKGAPRRTSESSMKRRSGQKGNESGDEDGVGKTGWGGFPFVKEELQRMQDPDDEHEGEEVVSWYGTDTQMIRLLRLTVNANRLW